MMTEDADSDSDLDINVLEELLAGAENENQDEHPETSHPKNASSFLENLDDIPVNVSSRKSDKGKPVLKEESVVHSGDTDSEDDEDKKYFHSRQYNEYGSSIKKMLQVKEDSKDSSISGFSGGSRNGWKSAPKPIPGTLCAPSTEVKQPIVDLNVDKLIGVRITNPIVSSTVLAERLQGRKIVSFATIKTFTSSGKITEDWVVVGVIVSKSPPTTSAKGCTYSIIKLSDLRGLGDLKTVSLFLFSGACKTHSKNSVGSVLGVLNPRILDSSKNRGEEAALSVDSADRIMVLGTSRDFGVCKSKKTNGENCKSFVNKASCDFCIYHVKQEYQNCSRRSELQSSYTGKGLAGGLNGLRNKVLGKSEVFYGGQSFMAIPAKKSNKLANQDSQRLSVLSGMSSSPRVLGAQPKGRIASSVELSHGQAKKDMERLRKLDDLGMGTNISGNRAVPNASLQNFSQTPKVEESESGVLAFISNLRESRAALKLDVEFGPKIMPLSDENSKITPKTATQLSRGAAFAIAATQKSSKPQMNQASAFGLGRKAVSKTSKMEDASPSRKPDTAPSISKPEDLVESPKRPKENTSLTKSSEPKILSRLIENRITKSMNSPKVEVKTEPPIIKASELGLGRGRAGAQTPQPSVSKVAPTVRTAVPTLGAGISPTGVIEFDLSSPSLTPMWKAPTAVKGTDISSSPKSTQRAKLKALNYVRAKGSIAKEDPNKLELANKKKSLGNKRTEPAKKRKIELAVEVSETGREKMKSAEEEKRKKKMAEFRALMEVPSRHADLVAKADYEAQVEYFDKLEKREKMEEKMLNTYKVDCKAVTCTRCKYTAFSAAEVCKEERHPLKVHDATKRFFKCADCGNRTCCLELIPLRTCSNCSSSRWERTAMIRERKVGIAAETLSIRGGEEKFIGSVVTGGNLNLLVPE